MLLPAPPRPSGGSATQLLPLSLNRLLFLAQLFLKFFEKSVNIRGSSMLGFEVIKLLKFNVKVLQIQKVNFFTLPTVIFQKIFTSSGRAP